MKDFKRDVTFSPAYDMRPKYGIHGVDIRFILQGPLGAVQFVMSTNWMLEHVQKELDQRTDRPRFLDRPMGTDVGYHSPKPMYEGQTSMDCDLIEGGQCYYDGSGLLADQWLREILIPEGSDGIWKALEKRYHETFIDRDDTE